MKLINLKKSERYSVIYGFLYSFVIISFFILAKSFRDAVFLNSYTNEHLSILYIISPIFSALLVWFINYFFDNYDLYRKSIFIHFLIFSISMIFLTNLKHNNILFYYVFVDFQISMIALLFWKSLSNTFDSRQAKRLYGIITSGGFLSALIIGTTLSFISEIISQKTFLIFFNFLILCCPFFIKKIESNRVRTKDSFINNSKLKFQNYFKNKYVINIILIIFFLTIICTFIDYYFKILSYEKFSNNQIGLTNYFARFYSISSFLSFLFQMFISSHIFKKFGVSYSLLILPLFLLFSLPFSLFYSSFIIIFFLKANEQILKPTLHDTSMQILWMPLPEFVKNKVKPLVNILFKNIFSSLSGLLILIFIHFEFEFAYVAYIITFLSFLLIIIMLNTRKHYISELTKAIDNRSFNLDSLNSINAFDNVEMLDTINEKLINNKKDRYFIIKLLDESLIKKCKKTLIDIYNESDIFFKKEVLKHFYNDIENFKNKYLIEQIYANNSLSVNCLKILFTRDYPEINHIIDDMCESDSMSLKYTAINHSLKFDIEKKNYFIKQLNNDINELSNCKYIIKYIDKKFLKLSYDQFNLFIKHLDYDLVLKSLDYIESKNSDQLWDSIIEYCSKNQQINSKLIFFFRNVNQISLYEYSQKKLLKSNFSNESKIFLIKIIHELNTDNKLNLYTKYLESSNKDDNISNSIIDMLIDTKLKNKNDILKSTFIKNLINEYSHSLYLLIRFSYLIEIDTKDRRIILEYFKFKINLKTKILIKLLYYNNDSLFSRQLNLNLISNELYFTKIVEIIEESLPEKDTYKIIPLLDDISILDKNNYSIKFYKNLKSFSIHDLTNSNMVGNDDWYDFISSSEWFNDDSRLFSKIMNQNQYFKLLFSDADNDEKIFLKNGNIKLIFNQMITSLEKTLYLKDSSIFKDIPAKELIYISQQLEEIEFQENSTIFRDGEIGNSMYFIFNGKIKISKGNQELVSLGKGDYFGEMALLDGEPRSANAITISNCVLLKLDSNKFNQILYSNKHVIKGVLSMLCDRLRNANNIINDK